MSIPGKRLMHLMGFNLFCPAQHSNAAWRHPLNTPKGYNWTKPAVWQHMARELERGKFDSIFFADQFAAAATYRGTADGALRNGVMFPIHDPLVLVPMLAAVTSRLGMASTLSTTYYPPYLAVRKLATLDHLTEGRAGWNIVTSFQDAECRAMGTELIPHDQRYARANEYMEICHKFWNSWEEDGLVYDVKTPMLVDPSKVHPFEFVGKYYKAAGFAANVPSPQHHPVLFQAGSSPAGRDFCARWAEAAFAVLVDTAQMKAYVNDMSERAQRYGRPPDAVMSFFGVQPIVGQTAGEAKEKQQQINELGSVDAGLIALSSHTGFDFSTVDPSALISSFTHDLSGITGIFKAIVEFSGETRKDLTIAEAAHLYSQSTMLKQIVGSGAQVAEQLISMWEDTGAHGFLTTPVYYPGAYTDFIDLVIPELQKRKVFRHDYSGRTLRDHLAQTSLS